jgi:Ran GTPase-activating protein (RanGAP) involved in mRNA processing and transport
MPSISHFDIYKPAEPCNLAGDQLREAMDRIVSECLSKDGKELNLKGYCVGYNGMTVITMDDRIGKVKRLNLGGNRIGDEGVQLVAEASLFSKVNWLELGGNDIGPRGIRALVNSNVLTKVKTLNLYRNVLKDEGAVILAKENKLQKIEDLDLAQNEIEDEGLLALAHSKAFPNLVAAYLDNNFASVEAREEAKLAPNFNKLQSLNL